MSIDDNKFKGVDDVISVTHMRRRSGQSPHEIVLIFDCDHECGQVFPSLEISPKFLSSKISAKKMTQDCHHCSPTILRFRDACETIGPLRTQALRFKLPGRVP